MNGGIEENKLVEEKIITSQKNVVSSFSDEIWPHPQD
jgi:hypothetical protein